MDPRGEAPLISVIVRTKDRPELLKDAIASLRAQSLQDFEVIVVNDGGRPPAREDLAPQPGKGLSIVSTEAPFGRAKGLNRGIAEARGARIAFVDDDDELLPDHLEALSRFLDGNTFYGAVYSDVTRVFSSLGEDGRYHETLRLPGESRPFDAGHLIYANPVPLIGLMVRKESLDATGAFDEAFDIYEDWDYVIRLSETTRIHHLARATALYKIRDDGTNATTEAPWLGTRAQEARARLYAKHWTRRSPATEMSILDARDHEIRQLAKRVDALVLESAAAKGAGARLEADLIRVRHELRETREREEALRRERSELAATLSRLQSSRSFRLVAFWWRLKAVFTGSR